MKVLVHKISLVFFLVCIAACSDNAKQEIAVDYSEEESYQIQFNELKIDFAKAQKKLADSPEQVNDPEKLARMTPEERLKLKGAITRYSFEKIRLYERSSNLIKNIEAAKDAAKQNKEFEKSQKLEALIIEILDFNKRVKPQ